MILNSKRILFVLFASALLLSLLPLFTPPLVAETNFKEQDAPNAQKPRKRQIDRKSTLKNKPPSLPPSQRQQPKQAVVEQQDVARNRSPHHHHFGPTVIVSDDDKGCKCDLVSVDCLGMISCLPRGKRAQQQQIALGVETREQIKRNVTYEDADSYGIEHYPIGKAFHYAVIGAWESWMRDDNSMPISFDSSLPSIFVKEKWYPYCPKHKRKGLSCFFGDLNGTEDLDPLEQDAVQHTKISEQAIDEIRANLRLFRKNYQEQSKRDELPALKHLLLFAHVARIRFHRQPPVHDFYKQHLKSVVHSKSIETIRVSLHMRRADSCEHMQTGYESVASPLNSVAQISTKRKCYDTGVYIKALRRIQRKAGKPLDVYLATDHAGNVMHEIRKNFTKQYKEWNWHYSNYSREMFRYEGMIEGEENTNQQILGETAVADMWHLSHGQVFVGHLGSKFGKASYLLATSRYNTFVPFFTVDGHSLCCEIDEQCAEAKPYIPGMQECLTFMHDFHGEPNKDYWEVGSKVRKHVVEEKKRLARETRS